MKQAKKLSIIFLAVYGISLIVALLFLCLTIILHILDETKTVSIFLMLIIFSIFSFLISYFSAKYSDFLDNIGKRSRAFINIDNKSAIKMKFNNFKNIYKISNENWEIEKEYIYYLMSNTKTESIFLTSYDCVWVYFSFVDYIRYLMFLKRIKTQEQNNKEMEQNIRFLKQLKKSIDDFEREMK